MCQSLTRKQAEKIRGLVLFPVPPPHKSSHTPDNIGHGKKVKDSIVEASAPLHSFFLARFVLLLIIGLGYTPAHGALRIRFSKTEDGKNNNEQQLFHFQKL
jgi:hypothetical protein